MPVPGDRPGARHSPLALELRRVDAPDGARHHPVAGTLWIRDAPVQVLLALVRTDRRNGRVVALECGSPGRHVAATFVDPYDVAALRGLSVESRDLDPNEPPVAGPRRQGGGHDLAAGDRQLPVPATLPVLEEDRLGVRDCPKPGSREGPGEGVVPPAVALVLGRE